MIIWTLRTDMKECIFRLKPDSDSAGARSVDGLLGGGGSAAFGSSVNLSIAGHVRFFVGPGTTKSRHAKATQSNVSNVLQMLTDEEKHNDWQIEFHLDVEQSRKAA